jgi:hypothetical protein
MPGAVRAAKKRRSQRVRGPGGRRRAVTTRTKTAKQVRAMRMDSLMVMGTRTLARAK